MRNEYKVLGLHQKATPEEVKDKYRELMRTAHPDKGGTTEQAANLSLSYNILIDRKARQKHDKALQLAGISACEDCRGLGTVKRLGKSTTCKTCGGTGWKE